MTDETIAFVGLGIMGGPMAKNLLDAGYTVVGHNRSQEPVDDHVANLLTAEFLYLQSVDPQKDVNLYINCPGGSVSAGMALYDTMQMLSCDISTYCLGQAASMGAVLMAAGTKGKRYVLPNARVMIHQPWGGTGGTAADINIQAQEIMYARQRLNEILAHHTGQTLEKIAADTDRDFFLSANQAVEYWLADSVLKPLDQTQNS